MGLRLVARPVRSSFQRRTPSALVVLALAGACLVTGASPANAVQARQSRLVSTVPAGFTPAVKDGTVFSIAAVGANIVLGGSFTKVSPAGSGTVYSLPKAMEFTARSGAIHRGFAPRINGTVNTVIPGPRAHQVYVGGTFSQVDGKSMRVALLDTRTGRLVPGWHPSAMNSGVNKLVLAGGRLFVGGAFTTVGGHAHHGLASLAPTTGKVTSYVGLSFTGHHNYDRLCDPKTTKCAKGDPGVRGMDVDPAGKRMMVTGDFTDASGHARDQVAMVDLGRAHAKVDLRWSTLAYSAECFANSFDSYIRDVQFSPDGSYFVIVATGGIGRNRDHTRSSCDAAARFETSTRGGDVRPIWIDYTGEDSLWSVAITGTAVYVGGHQRWLDNTLGENVAGPGAIPRPGVAALSPTSGLPYSWDPGRNPRGAGCFALLATSRGLWIGSDTDYIGNRQYLRPKVAFFPLAGGRNVPTESTPELPGWVYEVGATSASAADPDRLAYQAITSKSVGVQASLSTGVPWGSVRGAFTVDGHIVYGRQDGNLYERSFNGTSVGPEVELDPYNDPRWNNVATGSGQTYQSSPSTFSTEIPTLTSMFFTKGRLYYTLAGDSSMHWRWYEPESGVIDASEHTVTDHVDWSNIAGAFFANHALYFADQNSGKLMSVPWSRSGAHGRPKVVDAATDWASRGLFLLSKSGIKPPPPPKTKTIRYVGSTTAAGHGRSVSVHVPWATSRGDAMVLFASTTGSRHPSAPPGWKIVGRTHHRGLTTAVFDRVARAHDARSKVVVKTHHRGARSTLVLAAYQHTSAKPFERSASSVSGATKRHRTPHLRHLRRGTRVIAVWAAASRSRLRWHAPHLMRQRTTARRSGRPALGVLLAESRSPVSGGFSVGAATSSKRSRSGAQWVVALSPRRG
jgi:hypothetical protein